MLAALGGGAILRGGAFLAQAPAAEGTFVQQTH
jgi:hypothetical protein